MGSHSHVGRSRYTGVVLVSRGLGLLRHGLCSGYTRASETCEHLFRRSEGEVVQHEDDFLTVFMKLGGATDDKGRGHQALFLHVVMRVHPVRAGDRSIVISLNSAVRDRRGLRPGEAVLRPRWKLPMPVDKGSCAGFVGKIHAESFACSKANTRTPVGACQPEDFGWSAVHFQHARSRDKTLGSRRSPARGIG